jgi:diguanylate cyclase (GGDEF)-like protein
MRTGFLQTILWIFLSLPCAYAQVARPSSAENLPINSLGAPQNEPLFQPRFQSVGVGVIPRDVVASMAQDKAGFLWIATGDGLVRYDGYRFRPQEFDSNKPLERNLGWVRALLPARDGRLWIGSETRGLGVYDPQTDRVSFPRDERDSSPASMPQQTIFALAEDFDGYIWIGTVGSGLARFDPRSKRFTAYRHVLQEGNSADDQVQSLLVDRQGTLWIGTWNGLSRRLRGSQHFDSIALTHTKTAAPAKLSDAIETKVQSLFQASDGRIWVGTQQGAVAIIDPAKPAGLMLDQAVEKNTLRLGSVSSFAEAPGGQIWVGRSLGIDVYDMKLGKLLRRLRHDASRPFSLAGEEVTSMLMDHEGAIWVGGFGIGLQRHDPKNHSIWVRGADKISTSPLKNADVRSVLQLANGEVLAASHGGSVAVLDGHLRVIGSMRPKAPSAGKNGGENAPPFLVGAMAQAQDGSIWLGAETGLFQFDRTRQPVRVLPHLVGLTRRLLAGSDGRLWIGTQDGLYVLNPGGAKPVRVTLEHGVALSGEVNALAEGPDQCLWVGGVKGLFRVPKGSAQLHTVAASSGQNLGSSIVIGLLFDHQQRLWIDTAVAGLHRMQSWDGQFASYDRVSERHGIVSRPFGANLMEDARGRIWTHMYVYDPALDRLDALSSPDGVDFGTGWFFSYAKLSDGRFLFGGSKGLLVVKPELFDVSGYAPPLVVSELRINGVHQAAGPTLKSMQIAASQRSFSVEFSALDFSEPARNRYSYRLKGFDSEWIKTGSDFRVASYSNLSPGKYQLQVRATNRAGQWSANEMDIDVKVLPAWWQSWWFYVLMTLLLVSVAYSVYQLRQRKILWRQQALDRTAELEQLTKVLEQESIALKEASLTDPLTGLRNRRFLTQQIYADVALSWRKYESQSTESLLLSGDADLIFFLIDIDNFKQVNDQFGHAAGDAVITQLCDRLRQVFRETDYLVRWGGEEFLVVARATARTHGQELAERVRALVAEQPFQLDKGRQLSMSCSIGFSCFPLTPQLARALDWDAAIKTADAALYLVKTSGKNGWIGLIEAQGQSAAALREWVHQPLLDWFRSGTVTMAASPAQLVWIADGAKVPPAVDRPDGG